MTQVRKTRIQQTLKARQHDFTLLLDQVHKPQNLSAMMRTADSVGVPQIHAVELVSAIKTYKDISAGSKPWVTLNHHEGLDSAIEALESMNAQWVAAHFSHRAVSFREVDWTLPTVLILGAERDGVSPELAERANIHAVIPQMGMVRSLNVSVAAAVILYEMQLQRELAGLYDVERSLTQLEENKLFEALQPKLAQYCRQKGWPYPKLDAHGVVDNPELIK